MGLADHYEYRDDIRRGTAQIYHYYGTKILNGKVKIDEKSVNDDNGIRRFKSPVTISFIGDRIYFIFDDSYKEILGETFFLISDYHTKGKKIHTRGNVEIEMEEFSKRSATEKINTLRQHAKTIKVPDEFDVDGFMKEFTEYFNSQDVQNRLKEDLKKVNKSYGLAIGKKLNYGTQSRE